MIKEIVLARKMADKVDELYSEILKSNEDFSFFANDSLVKPVHENNFSDLLENIYQTFIAETDFIMGKGKITNTLKINFDLPSIDEAKSNQQYIQEDLLRSSSKGFWEIDRKELKNTFSSMLLKAGLKEHNVSIFDDAVNIEIETQEGKNFSKSSVEKQLNIIFDKYAKAGITIESTIDDENDKKIELNDILRWPVPYTVEGCAGKSNEIKAENFFYTWEDVSYLPGVQEKLGGAKGILPRMLSLVTDKENLKSEFEKKGIVESNLNAYALMIDSKVSYIKDGVNKVPEIARTDYSITERKK